MRAIPASRGLERWELRLVERDGTLVEVLDMEYGSGRDSWAAGQLSPHGMSATLLTEPPALRGRWLRAYYRAADSEWLLGTWVPTALRRSMETGADEWTIEGIDTTHLLARASIRRPLTCGTATPVTETVLGLLRTYAPSVMARVPDTDETLRAPLTWEAGTPVLEVCNALLEAAAYRPLAPNRQGVLLARREPGRPGMGATFRDDSDGMAFLPQMQTDDDLLVRANEVIAIAPGTADQPGLVGAWSDPVGIERDGLISETIRIEATSQEAANLAAARHAATKLRAARQLEVAGPWQPLNPGDGVRALWSQKDMDVECRVLGWSAEWSPGMETTWTLEALDE